MGVSNYFAPLESSRKSANSRVLSPGVAKGPALGAALRAAEEAWIAADFPGDSETLEQIATNAVQHATKVT